MSELVASWLALVEPYALLLGILAMCAVTWVLAQLGIVDPGGRGSASDSDWGPWPW